MKFQVSKKIASNCDDEYLLRFCTVFFSLVESGNDRNKFKYTHEKLQFQMKWVTQDSFEIECKFNSQEHKRWKRCD